MDRRAAGLNLSSLYQRRGQLLDCRIGHLSNDSSEQIGDLPLDWRRPPAASRKPLDRPRLPVAGQHSTDRRAANSKEVRGLLVRQPFLPNSADYRLANPKWDCHPPFRSRSADRRKWDRR